MKLSSKTLEKLRNLINEETEYRSGPKLVKFFNQFGFNDSYGQGFPSRWFFTDEKLKKLNDTADMDKCIKNLFAPVSFINQFKKLDDLMEDFNQYLAFDGFKIIRNEENNIIFSKSTKININELKAKELEEEEFLKTTTNIKIDKLKMDANLLNIIDSRIKEIEKCVQIKAPLAIIFLSGSTLEAILLHAALQKNKNFNQASSSPKDKNKVKQFQDWTLNSLIDVACEVGLLKEHIKKFSHGLKDFRNYIHPYQQMNQKFTPDMRTAELCFKVLQFSIEEIIENIDNI